MTPFAERLPTASSAFTLSEIVIVIAVMAILASLLLPTLTRAEANAQGVACPNNLKQRMLARTM